MYDNDPRFLIDDQGRTNKDLKPLYVSPTIRSEMHGNEPRVVEPVDFDKKQKSLKGSCLMAEITKTKPFKYVSLFAGIGGFETALSRLGGECVFASEIDKYAQKAYDVLYDGSVLHDDVTEIDAQDVPDHDVLVGGFPCQAFSVAGKQGGFNDARGTLFFEAARIIAEKKPQVVMLENVKGLVGHDKGRTLNTIVTALNECGYAVDFEVLNSKYFGVPQNRERIFIIGILNEKHGEWTVVNDKGRKDAVAKGKRRIAKLDGVKTFNFDWPEQAEVTMRLRDVLEDEVDERFYLSDEKTAKLVENLRDREKYSLAERASDDVNACYSPEIATKNQNGRRIKPNDDPMCALTNRDRHGVVEPYIVDGKNSFGNSYKVFDEGIAPTCLSNDFKEPKKVVEPQVFGNLNHYANDQMNRVYAPDGVSPTVTVVSGGGREQKVAVGAVNNYGTVKAIGNVSTTIDANYHKGFDNHGQRTGVITNEYRIRKLTPRECFRLQAFTDAQHDALEAAGISNSQRYKLAGNAVTVNVVEAIGQNLLSYL